MPDMSEEEIKELICDMMGLPQDMSDWSDEELDMMIEWMGKMKEDAPVRIDINIEK